MKKRAETGQPDSPRTDFSIWLLPSTETSAYLKSIIVDLAKQYNAPNFEPHLTLFCGSTPNLEKTTADLERFASDQDSIELTIQEVDATKDFHKTLFLQFGLTEQLANLNKSIQSELDPNSQYHLNPHMSLLYKALKLHKKKALAEKIDATLDIAKINDCNIKFDQIVLALVSPEANAQAVSSWKILSRQPLSDSANIGFKL